ncbi:hypothetical protein [Photobacterium indicum]|uniref:hypothetical protein n=1 Tax=Photobacterium indicum TaxID=81447 RepID=UPI003D147CC9
MAINIQLNDGVRFFDNGREIVVVTAAYAPKYLKAKAYSNKEVFEVTDLATQIAAGRSLSFWSGVVQSLGQDAQL